MLRKRAAILRRLVYIPKASQMDPADMQAGHVENSVFEGLEFKAQAGLYAIRWFVIFSETHDDRITEETA